jgi:hypothetical protein
MIAASSMNQTAAMRFWPAAWRRKKISGSQVAGYSN